VRFSLFLHPLTYWDSPLLGSRLSIFSYSNLNVLFSRMLPGKESFSNQKEMPTIVRPIQNSTKE
jgi:hypothetical protein